MGKITIELCPKNEQSFIKKLLEKKKQNGHFI